MFRSKPHLLKVADILRDNAQYAEAREYFNLSVETINNFLLSLDTAARVDSLTTEERPVFISLLTLLKSALHDLAGAMILADEALIQQVPVLTRAIYENLITMRYLLEEDRLARSEQFLAAEILGEKRIVDWMNDPNTPRDCVVPEVVAQQSRINAEFAAFMSRYFPTKKKAPLSWHGMPLVEFFRRVKKPSAHAHAYPMLSASVHSDVTSIRLHSELLRVHGARAAFATHRLPGEIRSQLRLVIGLFLECWGEYSNVFQPSSMEIVDTLKMNLLNLAVSDYHSQSAGGRVHVMESTDDR